MDYEVRGRRWGKTAELNRRKAAFEDIERRTKLMELSKTFLKCKHCGEDISQYGPETFHIDSTLIRCVDGVNRAEVVND